MLQILPVYNSIILRGFLFEFQPLICYVRLVHPFCSDIWEIDIETNLIMIVIPGCNSLASDHVIIIPNTTWNGSQL